MTSHGYKQNEISQELSMGTKSSKQVTVQFKEHFRLRK
jgi:hypothetical protein